MDLMQIGIETVGKLAKIQGSVKADACACAGRFMCLLIVMQPMMCVFCGMGSASEAQHETTRCIQVSGEVNPWCHIV